MRILIIIMSVLVVLAVGKLLCITIFSKNDETEKKPVYKILVNGFGEYKIQNSHGEDFVRTTSSIMYIERGNEYVKDTLYGFKNMESEDVVNEEVRGFLTHGHKIHTVIKYTNYNEAVTLVDSLITDYKKHTYTEVTKRKRQEE